MKKQIKTKWDFIKTSVVELTSKNLITIKGGVEVTGVDLPDHTFTKNGNGGVISSR